ncbi:hypothetical protein [Tenacibaculum finnmarkense]|uniref:hypothetical protein n=1 Tax=Tenacibaculum finnmarkense TaxID=2781243 RepID=UPI00187B8BDE|nr:hypothetical protein [Tenacibaculum finnmarkense]MBE7659244.1 hypothetical protein [Tenacibaculum finnmarkense genomovar finnmarkense]MCD8418059.1 hypothetical protein [Tenacibaculum finnmarkense genomovar finnmarkense]MCG8185116.1 hypothetical protein [Tenacibaculum finnmarkense genomovar finnmarkense]MCG8251335.1 hypothetical protein [Tenacibaculum finnmarkense genomovar finnmarkense]MCG8791725.1 hypothetical protein [Tenacibaculum finnmarkense]
MYNDFYFSKNKIISKGFDKVYFEINKDERIKEGLIFKNNKLNEKFNDDNTLVKSNDNIYIIKEGSIQGINTSMSEESLFEFYLLKHILKMTIVLGDEIESVSIADFCLQKIFDAKGGFQGSNIDLNNHLAKNEKQIVLKGNNYIYSYIIEFSSKKGVDLDSDKDLIVRYQLSNHYNPLSQSAIEHIYLNENNSNILTVSTKQTDFDYSFSENKFSWKSADEEQIYSIKKNTTLTDILNELF